MEKSNSIEKKIGKYSFTMYEAEEVGYISFGEIRDQLLMYNKYYITLVNKIVTEEFEDLEIIFDENKPFETNFLNKKTGIIYNACFNLAGELLIDEVDRGSVYLIPPTKKDYESIKKDISELIK